MEQIPLGWLTTSGIWIALMWVLLNNNYSRKELMLVVGIGALVTNINWSFSVVSAYNNGWTWGFLSKICFP